jgi:MFS family permease
MLDVLKNVDLRRYMVGNTLSSIGTWFQNLAAAILIFRLTGSTLLVGVVNFAMFSGALILAPWAGSAADRFDRRRLLLVNQVAAAVIVGGMAAVVLAGRETTLIVMVASALLGLTFAFTVPALLALIPLLVPREDLEAAVALNSVTFNLARAVGPVLAALVVDQWGVGAAFAVNAVSFAVFAVVLRKVRPREQVRAQAGHSRLRDSIKAVREIPIAVPLLVSVVAVSLTSDPVNTLTPEFAVEAGGSDTMAGWLVGAFGLGATISSVTLAGWLRKRQRVLAAALAVEAAGMVVFALAPGMIIASLGMALAGAGFITALARATARIQLEVPEEMHGRVMALWSLAFIGTRPFGSLLDGALADAFGVRTAALVLAAPALLAALWLIRRVRPRLIDAGVITTGAAGTDAPAPKP